MAADGVVAADPATVALHDRLHPNPLGTSAQLPEPDIQEATPRSGMSGLVGRSWPPKRSHRCRAPAGDQRGTWSARNPPLGAMNPLCAVQRRTQARFQCGPLLRYI